MPSWELRHGGLFEVSRGDITRAETDGIVNAANSSLLGGGGVDGAIHGAAGAELLRACRAIPEVRPGVRCPVGEARITPGFHLVARHVLHTVGPVYQRAADPAGDLARCYRSCLDLAHQHGLTSLAFPAISCGAYGYPLDEAAKIAVDTVVEHSRLDLARFVLLDADAFEAWLEASAEALGTANDPW